MTTKFVTIDQKQILAIAKELTDSTNFMQDARAIAAYQDGFEGNPDYLKAVMVFECFRGGAAETHFGMAFGRPLSLEIIQLGVLVSFHPKLFNLNRIIAKVPVDNVRVICSMLKMGFQMEHRERGVLRDGTDAIVLTLTRAHALSQNREPTPEIAPTE